MATPIYEFNTTTSHNSGNGTAECQVSGIEPGTYDITVVTEHTLVNVNRNVVISTGDNTVDMGTLFEGDAKEDTKNQINLADLSVLAGLYLASTGDPA